MTWHEPQNLRDCVALKPETFAVPAVLIGKIPRPRRSQSFVFRPRSPSSRGRRTRCITRMAPAARALAADNQSIQPTSLLVLIRSHIRSKIDAALVVAILGSSAGTAHGQLRLRGDAFVQTRSPVGLIVLRGEDKRTPWLDAETVTWLGAISGSDPSNVMGDVLTLSVRGRDPTTGSELRIGRMLVSMGAVRPVHIDGVRGLARAFGGTTVEAFGGFPVVQRFGYDTFDWTAGGRVGQAIGDTAALGGSYSARRRGGHRDDEEVGIDAALTPAPWLTAAGRAAYDVVSRGPTDALLSVSAQKSDVRGEIFTTHRSPGRLLPHTSIFSVLGDFAATSGGATARWRAFPRLELIATGSVQVQGGDVGGQGLGRATLALDDTWASSIGFEARRVDFGGVRWVGARAIATKQLSTAFRLATELELVRPDDDSKNAQPGVLWPWALGSIAWSSLTGWEVATAIEASSGPSNREGFYALARLSYAMFDARQEKTSR
jgi:hypothetical protein